MSDYKEQVIQNIKAVVYNNRKHAISGDKLQAVLIDMISKAICEDEFGEDYPRNKEELAELVRNYVIEFFNQYEEHVDDETWFFADFN